MAQPHRLAFLSSRPTVTALVLCLVAVLLWVRLQPVSVRFADTASWLLSGSQLTGILGLVLFSLTLFLSARFKWMERLMGALNRLYIEHHLIGAAAFLFLLVHPMLALMHALLIRRPNMAHLIVPGLDLSITWGILSLWLLIVLMVLTLYLRPKYGLWRRTHQYMGLALFFAGLHGLSIPSDISASPALRWYLLSIASVSFVLYVSYTILNRVTVQRFAYTVSRVDHTLNTVLSINLVPTTKPLLARAGQFMFIRFFLDGKWSEAHPFSLTSIANEHGLSLSFKVLGDDTQWFFDQIEEGTRAQIEGPFGLFGKELSQTAHAVCVAGGIGVTPFLSLLQTIQPHQSVDFYYCIKNEQEGAHTSELHALADASVGKVRVIPWYSDTQGLLTGAVIQRQSALNTGDRVFVCGPPGMMRAVRAQLTQLGFAKDHIHTEEFSLDS